MQEVEARTPELLDELGIDVSAEVFDSRNENSAECLLEVNIDDYVEEGIMENSFK